MKSKTKLIKSILSVCIMQFGFYTQAQVTSASFDTVWAAQFQAAIDNSVAAYDVQGISVAIYIPGQGTFIGVAGESHAGLPITPDMQFGIGSNSKLFTAVVVMKLVEEGVLSLDDRIGDWLPDYQYIDPDITIRQLLNHHSGINDFEQELFPHDNFLTAMDTFIYGPQVFYQPGEVLAMLNPPNFPAGEKYSYSNTNYLIAAMIVEAASGESFIDKLHEYILDPLDLDSTFAAAWEGPNGNVAEAWHLGDNIGNVPNLAAHSMYLGSGNIFSTANEMVQWFDNLFTGNVLTEQSLDEIRNFDGASFYGMGLQWVHYPTEPDVGVYEHGGWVPGYTSDCAFDVSRKASLAFLGNDEDESAVLFPLIYEVYENYPRKVNDAGITMITKPASESCNGSITPVVMLRNFGSSSLTSVIINYQVDQETVLTYNWSGNLLTDETASVSLPAITASAGRHAFRAFTSVPNGNAEGYTYNDESTSNFVVNSGAYGTLIDEGFEGNFPPDGWLNGRDGMLDWRKSRLSLLSGNGCAVKANGSDDSFRPYALEMPPLDLTSLNKPELSFNYAYGFYAHGSEDALSIMVSTDCGATYQTIWHKSGNALKTADSQNQFFPNDGQWALKKINLSNFKNKEVLIKFVGTSGVGNNLYLDNVKIANKQGNVRLAGLPATEFSVYPNPLSNSTNISLMLDESQKVSLKILDVNGRLVSTIADKIFEAGENQIMWNADRVEDGIYFLKKETESGIENQKLIITR